MLAHGANLLGSPLAVLPEEKVPSPDAFVEYYTSTALPLPH
jgi:hypothetical protein